MRPRQTLITVCGLSSHLQTLNLIMGSSVEISLVGWYRWRENLWYDWTYNMQEGCKCQIFEPPFRQQTSCPKWYKGDLLQCSSPSGTCTPQQIKGATKCSIPREVIFRSFHLALHSMVSCKKLIHSLNTRSWPGCDLQDMPVTTSVSSSAMNL